MINVIRRTLLLCLLVAAASAALPTTAGAQDDTTAIAINTRDESSIFRLAFNIRRVTDGVVDQTNAAVALASCQDCRTVAIAIQVLLVASDPTVVAPENLALALNHECTLCDTFASAYQIVLGDGTLLRFTAEGSQEIAQIRRELEALRNQDLSDGELSRQLGSLVDRLRGVLDSELVGVGEPTEPPPPAPESEQTETQPPATTTPADATPTQTTPVETTPAPAEATPSEPLPTQTTTTPVPTQTTP